MKSSICSALFFILVTLTLPAYGNELGYNYQYFHSGLWQFDWTTTHVASDANYDNEGGGFLDISGINNIVHVESKLAVSYGLSKNWNIWTQGAFGYIETVTKADTRSNSGLSYLDLGTQYRLYGKEAFQIIPSLRGRVPITTVDPASDEAIFTEGSTEFEGLLLLQSKISYLRSHAYAGFRYRDDGRSSQIPWGLGTELWYGHWAFGGGIQGYTTSSDDQYTGEPSQRHDLIDQVNAESRIFYSVNPERMTYDIWLRYAFDKQLFVKGGFEQSFNGKNSAVSNQLFVTVSYYIWPIKKRRERPYQNFRINTDDGVDHRKLFESPRDDQTEEQRRLQEGEIQEGIDQIDDVLGQ